MANNQSLQILRGTSTSIASNSSLVLKDGQPLYDKTNQYLYVGDGNTVLSNSKPVTTDRLYNSEFDSLITFNEGEELWEVQSGIITNYVDASTLYSSNIADNGESIQLGIQKDIKFIECDGQENGGFTNIEGRNWYIHASGEASLGDVYSNGTLLVNKDLYASIFYVYDYSYGDSPDAYKAMIQVFSYGSPVTSVSSLITYLRKITFRDDFQQHFEVVRQTCLPVSAYHISGVVYAVECSFSSYNTPTIEFHLADGSTESCVLGITETEAAQDRTDGVVYGTYYQVN